MTLFFYQFQRNLQAQQNMTILLKMSPPFDGIIQAMFDIYYQVFEAMRTPSDKISEKNTKN